MTFGSVSQQLMFSREQETACPLTDPDGRVLVDKVLAITSLNQCKHR
jgi:hypothetical protein